ncbi:MAG: T9SS type A sorting domain-containing protein [Chitinophagaceae bacterium]|nr:MAG: T9SS type A sorting domain-containing protein [Chitinophagaceae bacterium]
MTQSALSVTGAAPVLPATQPHSWIRSFRKMLLPLLAFAAGSTNAQVTLFSENMGSGGGSGTAISATTFQNSVLSFSGTADVRSNVPSTTYSGASGANAIFITNVATRDFVISGINNSGWTNLSLSFGLYKSTNAIGGLVVETSSDGGTTYSPLTITAATGSGTSSVWLSATATGTPFATGTNVRVRFRNSTTGTQYRIDDVKMIGTPLTPSITSIAPATVASGGSSFQLTVNGSNFIQGLATGAKSTVLVNGIAMTTSFVSASQLTATVTAAAITNAGQYPVVVSTTDGSVGVNSASSPLLVTGAPAATTTAATVTNGSGDVVLNGSVSANGLTTTASFDWGYNNTYGNTVAAAPSGITSQSTAVSATISGLVGSFPYHYRVRATNTSGTVNGTDMVFYSAPATPGSPFVTNPTVTSLYLYLDTANNYSLAEFAIQETTTGQYVQANGTLGASPVWLPVSVGAQNWGGGSLTVTGLNGGTTYSFRLAARNSDGLTTPFGATGSGTTLVGNTLNYTSGAPASICNASPSSYTINFTSGGSYSGNFYVQISDANGVFPANTTDNRVSAGGTTSPLTMEIPAGFTAGTGYRIRVINDNPAFYSADNGSNITVNSVVTPSVTFSANPGTTICAGTSVTFTATPVNGGTPSFQWTKNGSNVGNNSSSYTDAGLADGDLINVTMTSSVGCVTNSTSSQSAAMTVNTTPAPPVPTATAVCGAAILNAIADPGAPLVYYWQGTTANGTRTDSVATAAYNAGGQGTFYLRAYNTATGCWSGTSTSVSTVGLVTAAPAITQQPASVSGYAQGGITFISSATSSTFASRSWEVSTDGGNNWTAVTAGAPYTIFNSGNNSYLAISPLTAGMAGYQYRVLYTGNTPCGNVASSVATIAAVGAAQAQVFLETVGTTGPTSGGTNVNSYTGWANGQGLTFGTTNATDARTSVSSSGYAGASGSSGVFMGTSGGNTKDLTIASINTSGYTNLVLSFGMLRTNTTTTLDVEVSTDGTVWTPLTFSYPVVTSTWTPIVATGSIPSAGNLRIRFTKNGTGDVRLDDIRLAGNLLDPTTTSINPTSVFAGAGNTSITVTGTNFVSGKTAVTFNGSTTGVTTGTVTATTASATISSALLASVGTAPIGVTVTGAVNASNTQTLSIVDAPPVVSTGVAVVTNGSSSVTLNGTVNANNVSTTASFEYGTTNTYGAIVAAQQNPVTGGSNTAVTANVSSLSPNVTYHFRAVASSSAGSNNGNDATFVSPAATPNAPAVGNETVTTLDVTINDPSNPAGTEYAILETSTNRYVQANGSLGISALWQTAGAAAGQWGNNSGNPATARVTGLSAGTQYTFVVIARNSDGITTAASGAGSATTIAGNSITITSGVPASVCNASNNQLTIGFNASNGFSGNFFVQLSDASGAFPANVTDNIISAASATSPVTATIPAGYAAGTGYRVRIVNDNPVFFGSDNGADLAIVAALTPSVSIAANTGSTVCSGTSVTFTATPVNGGTPSYQWMKNGGNVGANSASYTDAALLEGDMISVVMTSSLSCISTATATSNVVTMTVNSTLAPAAPTAAANPSCGATALDAMSDPGSGVNYFWQGTAATGTSTALPATAAYPVTSSGSYYVRAFNSNTGCWSSAAGLAVTVAPALVVTTQPFNTSVTVGSTAILTAAASNAVSTQWQVNTGGGFTNISNGGNYSGATTGSLSISGTTLAMTGYQYRAVFTGTAPCTTVTSNTVTLSVFPTPATLFVETMGTLSTSTDIAVGSYTNWANPGFTFDAGGTTTDVRNTTSSTGYTGASGVRNVFFGTGGGNQKIFEISNINTSLYSNLQLSFGLLRTNTTNGMTVEVSADGSNYTALSFTQPATSNQWMLVTASGQIPSASNLRIRFSKNSTTSFRLDDVKLTGNPAVPVTTSISPASVVEGSNAFTLTVNGSNFVPSSLITWNGSSAGVTTTYVSSTQLTAAIPAGFVANAGSVLVGVSSNGAVSTSNTQTFTISPRSITINSLSANTFCNGAANTFNVSFTATGSYTGSYYVQLSNAAGTFPNNVTDNLISAAATGSPITATFSAAQAPSPSYRVRVVNTAPQVLGTGVPITVNDGDFSISVAAQDQFLCTAGTGTTIQLSGGPANGQATYTINGGGSQTVNLDGSGSASLSTGVLSSNATYTVTSVTNGTCTRPVGVSATVYVGAIAATTGGNRDYCAGVTTPAQAFTGNFPAGTQFSWVVRGGTQIGMNPADTIGTGSAIPSFVTQNATSQQLSARVSVRPIVNAPAGCKVSTSEYVIRVNPQPAVVVTGGANQVVCAGTVTAPIQLQGNLAGGMTFRWASSNTAVGTLASGAVTSTIPAFTAQNSTANASEATTFTITPYVGSCAGTPVTTTLTVNRSVSALTYAGGPAFCSSLGTITPRVTGGSGGTYSYVNLGTNTATGLSLNTTTGAVNTLASVAGTYRVTYTIAAAAGSCAGSTSTDFTISPKVEVAGTGNRTICSGSPLLITFSSPQSVQTTITYTWAIGPVSGSSPAALGLPTSGTGTTISATPVNNTGAPVRVMVQVKATPAGAGYCASTTSTFYVTINNCGTITQTGDTGGSPAMARSSMAAPGQVMAAGDAGFAVGPNPTQGQATIYLQGELVGKACTVQVLTQQGVVISRPATVTGNRHQVDLSGLPPGIYLLRLTDTRSGKAVSRQLIKL